MSANLIEELLNEEESSTLDFKRDQYKFDTATSDHVKSELLKDVLAFANTWRRTEAYILIGVDRRKRRQEQASYTLFVSLHSRVKNRRR
jgi:Ni,Fe-hydrogenase III component G